LAEPLATIAGPSEVNVVTLRVTEHLKGDVSGTVTIWTQGPGACGFDFRLGDSYLVYARREADKPHRFWTSCWTRTTLRETADKEVNKLRRSLQSGE
jgi:hypothetical protein